MTALLLMGCGPTTTVVGDFRVTTESDGTLSIDHVDQGPVIDGLRFLAGTGDAEIHTSFGAFLFEDVTLDLVPAARLDGPRGRLGVPIVEARDADGADLGLLTLAPAGGGLVLDWSPSDPSNRLAFEAPCDADDHFLGLGGHAQDVDHVGEAFGLWVQEPGVGKGTDDSQPDNWPVGGPKHATSFPVPFLLRPHRDQGLLVDTSGRVDVDLCATSDQFRAVAWTEGPLRVVLFDGTDPLDPVRSLADYTGRYTLPPPWVFAPWNDAIRGSARVREVAATLRSSGAPSSVIWTEDWKGGSDSQFAGYALSGEWSLDESLYPDAAVLSEELEADGFQWLAYFAPFLRDGTTAWDEALAAEVMIRNEDGDPYVFPGFTFEDESMLDLTDPDAVDWAQERMQAALDLGFDGWMTDFGEWLPTDAVLAGADPLEFHNLYPEAWQATSRQVLDGTDTVFFVRSGWTGTTQLVPVVWGGDQRTDFAPDDGMPTVVAMGVGLAASGVPVFTHDVAGYQSVGNPPSTKELWFRWASLGAFTPILRTHHGAFEADNWQFDSDAETLEHWARMATEHMRLFPYRYGLAAKAAADGTPMILPPAIHGGDWARTDAWLLGEALLVAPVMTAGATGRDVTLPPDMAWYDWWTHEPVQSGFFAADVDEIPVFAAAGTTVPVFAQVPATLVPSDAYVDLADADTARIVYLFAGGGRFVEADGTTYTPSGTPTGPGETTATLTDGVVEVAGVSLAVDGPVERAYTVFVVP